MEFKDSDNIIFQNLNEEFANSKIYSWADFIEQKNIGITYCVDTSYKNSVNIYQVVNIKKWIMSKIKYGV